MKIPQRELNPHFQQILRTVMLNVLEQHFFLLLDPPTSFLPESFSSVVYEVGMKFSGDLNGEFILIIPEQVAAEAYTGMTGGSTLGSSKEFKDTAKEILNYLGPNILIDWAERTGRPDFTVTIPSCQDLTNIRWKQILNNLDYISFMTNGDPILLAFAFNASSSAPRITSNYS